MSLLSAVLASQLAVLTAVPLECVDLRGPGARDENVWERVKAPELRRFCDLLASASTKLGSPGPSAGAALVESRKAEAILPEHPSARAMEGRALAAMGKAPEARLALEDAASRDARVLDDPATLHALARVLAVSGQRGKAEARYRELLPRAGALAASERAAIEVEAGLVAVSLGPEALDAAAFALREAVRGEQDQPAKIGVLALALVLDRRGDAAGAQAVLSEHGSTETGAGGPRALLATTRARDLLAVAPAESAALLGIALERTDPEGAREAWHAYRVAAEALQPQGPWVAHARAHEGGGLPPRTP